MTSQAAPRKRMKAGITRVRTGCYTCRRRKVKCDEAKPECRACRQLGQRCDGYAPQFKFCDPQTIQTSQWATTTVPSQADSPAQQPVTPETLGAFDQPLYSISSASVTTRRDNASQSPLSGTDASEYSKPPISIANSQIQSHTDVHMQLSPFNNASLDTAEDSESTHSNTYTVRSLSPARMSVSSDDRPSPIRYADTSHMPTMLDNIFANFNDHVYEPSPLTRMSDTPPPSDLYFAEWHNGVANLLPPVFRDITAEMPEFPPLRDAVLAISAAYLAHLQSLIVRTTDRTRKTRYIPQKDHKYQSLQFYNRGIQGIRKSLETLSQTDPLHVLASMLLFYYFELDSGSFAGGTGHMTVIDKFISSAHEEIKSSLTGRKLLSTWMNLRSLFVNRYLGGYRSSKPTDSIDTFPLNRMIADGEPNHDSITIMMCDCKVISRKIILDLCVARAGYRSADNKTFLDDILTQMSLPKLREESALQLAMIDESYRDTLEKQRARLDKWHSNLSLSELPIDSYTSQQQDLAKRSITELDVYPLKFHSFDAAMNYAYYAHAHMLCSEETMNRIGSPRYIDPPFTRRDCPWVKLILRITAGLYLADCIHKNTFSTGIVSILSTCIVICPRADVAAWIEDWIRKVEDFGVLLESGLPLGMAKRVIRFVVDQRQNARDVFLILPLDTEDAEKSDLYHSDFKMQVVVCGRDKRTGKLYNETDEIPQL